MFSFIQKNKLFQSIKDKKKDANNTLMGATIIPTFVNSFELKLQPYASLTSATIIFAAAQLASHFHLNVEPAASESQRGVCRFYANSWNTFNSCHKKIS